MLYAQKYMIDVQKGDWDIGLIRWPMFYFDSGFYSV